MSTIEIVDPRVEQYAVEHTTPEPPWFAALAEETRASTSAPGMMVGTLEGRFLTALVAMLRPRSVLEIGTFTGYSALSMAEALPPGGRIVTCDISEEHAAIARKHIGAGPYADRIEIRVGPAIDTIADLPGPFDLVFIDADKAGYLAYYEATLPKLSPDGVIAVDNVLWSGRPLDSGETDADTVAIREFNDRLAADDRVEVVMLTVRDGVSLVRHRRAAPAG
jgi:caffeoyl-CoA O-methyltransferase